MTIVIVIVITVMVLLLLILLQYKKYGNFNEHIALETVWTVIPFIVLMLIAYPSLSLLYRSDHCVNPGLTVKAIGSQWYWSYEYGDFSSNKEEISFESYMTHSSELKEGDFRLLEVDQRLILPISQNIRVITSSTDVIHSWSVPSLGFKIDCVPGRLNQIFFNIFKSSLYMGGCSEICGSGHGYMPTVIEGVSMGLFLEFIAVFEEEAVPHWEMLDIIFSIVLLLSIYVWIVGK